MVKKLRRSDQAGLQQRSGYPVPQHDDPPEAATRNVLLLQGPSSPFFAQLGHCLKHRGADVCRVMFCPGDALYWRASCGEAVAFRGPAEEWASFFQELIKTRNITDVVCLGDTRWQHRVAIEVLEEGPVTVHVVEHGYLRPGWLTVEQGGIGPNSRLPLDRTSILAMAAGLGSPDGPAFGSSFLEYAVLDIGYHLANLTAGWAWFPRYRRHAIDHPFKEWAGWIGRLLSKPLSSRLASETMKRIRGKPFFLIPLQLETDFQIRLYGPDGSQKPQIARIIESFAARGPADQHLVFKMHPLDNGWTPWKSLINKTATNSGIGDRCHYIEEGDLGELLGASSGVLTVNSTVGLEAISRGLPVHISGKAIYKVDGLVNSGPLEEFWTQPEPPDHDLADALIRLLKNHAMLPGAFDGSGASIGTNAIADRICRLAEQEVQ